MRYENKKEDGGFHAAGVVDRVGDYRDFGVDRFAEFDAVDREDEVHGGAVAVESRVHVAEELFLFAFSLFG